MIFGPRRFKSGHPFDAEFVASASFALLQIGPGAYFQFPGVDQWTTQVRNSIFRAIELSMVSNAARIPTLSLGNSRLIDRRLRNEAGSLTDQGPRRSPRGLATAARPFRRGSAKGAKERGLKRTREAPPKPSAKVNFAQLYASPIASDEFFHSPGSGNSKTRAEARNLRCDDLGPKARIEPGFALAKAVRNAGHPR